MVCEVQRDDRELRLLLRADSLPEHEVLRQFWLFLPLELRCSIYQEKGVGPMLTHVTIHFPYERGDHV